MAELIPMLALSPTMEEATIVKWTKSEGDQVNSGDVLCEVETDKAVMEYETEQEGTLLKTLLGEGAQCGVGDPIAIIGEEGENIDDLLAEAKQAGAAKPQAASRDEGAQEEEEKAGEPEGVPEEMPEKESRSEREPRAVSKKGSEGGEDRRVREPLAGSRTKASPLARKLADQAGLDISRIEGTGPGGRVVKRDVEQAAAEGPARAPAAALVGSAAGETPEITDEQSPVSTRRRIIAQRLSESMYSAPHFYLTVTAALDDLLAARQMVNESVGRKVSLNAFLIKFAAEAIAHHPTINCTWEGDTIHRHGSVDVGLAVALDDGLITPIVRDCSRKGLLAIDTELGDLVDRARKGKLASDEYTGATFTISNLGSYGVEEFTAIINPPGSAILAVGQAARQPLVSDDDELIIRTLMKLTLSCDHRVIDGAVAAEFMRTLKGLLENPVRPVLAVEL